MKILSVGIHASDCEYGMGGTAALLAERGHEVLFVNLKSPSEKVIFFPDRAVFTTDTSEAITSIPVPDSAYAVTAPIDILRAVTAGTNSAISLFFIFFLQFPVIWIFFAVYGILFFLA